MRSKTIKDLAILTAKSNLYLPILDNMRSRVQKQDYLVLTAENHEDVLASVKVKPMFSTQHIVEVHMRGLDWSVHRDIKSIILGDVKLDKSPLQYTPIVTFIFICQTVGELNKVRDTYEDYMLLNCYRIPHIVFHNYAQTFREMPESMTKDLWGRLRTRYDLTDIYLTKVAQIPEERFSLKEVRKIVPKFNKISFQVMWFSILMGDNKKQIYELYEDYRFGGKFFIGKMKEMSSETLALYKEFYNGNLTTINKQEWYNNQEISKKKRSNTKLDVSSYKVPYVPHMYLLDRYLEVFENVSYDSLVYVDWILNETTKDRLHVLENLMRIESRLYTTQE